MCSYIDPFSSSPFLMFYIPSFFFLPERVLFAMYLLRKPIVGILLAPLCLRISFFIHEGQFCWVQNFRLTLIGSGGPSISSGLYSGKKSTKSSVTQSLLWERNATNHLQWGWRWGSFRLSRNKIIYSQNDCFSRHPSSQAYTYRGETLCLFLFLWCHVVISRLYILILFLLLLAGALACTYVHTEGPTTGQFLESRVHQVVFFSNFQFISTA